MGKLSQDDLSKEFDRQVETLLVKGYPQAAQLPVNRFLEDVKPLKDHLQKITAQGVDLKVGRLPFVIVVKQELVATDKAMALVDWHSKPGVINLFPHEFSDFSLIESVSVPEAPIYLLVDIDRGQSNIDLPPNQALKQIVQAQRSPLTIDEGIALVTHFPEFLIKNNCFSLLASRYPGNQRVPAIWISQKQPKLGWCWDGNPHTWLGSASCKLRLA